VEGAAQHNEDGDRERLAWAEVWTDARRRVRERWARELAGAVVVAVLVLLYQWWGGHGFTESRWDKVTSSDFIAPLVGVGIYVALVTAWLLLTSPFRVSLRHAATLRQERDATTREVERLSEQISELLSAETSREAAATQMDDFAREYEILRGEIPDDPSGEGPVWSQARIEFAGALDHIFHDVASELRRHAPGFVPYWQRGPSALSSPSTASFNDAVDLAIEQLGYIARRLREGRDAPSTNRE